jgi:hypothetical protein
MPSVTVTISSDLAYDYTAGAPVTITISSGTIAAALAAIGTSGFIEQCKVAMALVAVAVLQEDGTLANAASRFDFARLVLNNPTNFVASAVYPIASDGVTNGSSTDQVLVDRVLFLWNQLCYGA